MDLQMRFLQLLVRVSAELHEGHRDQMSRPDYCPPPT
jgi:hypothetical protein